MKKRTLIAASAIAATTLVSAAALPAAAAVNYTLKAAPSIGSLPALDSSTNTIYSIKVVTESAPSTYQDTYLTAVDATTFKTKSSLEIGVLDTSSTAVFGVTDLRVNSRTHTIWVDGYQGRGGGFIDEINGTSMTVVRSISSFAGEVYQGEWVPGTIAVNPTTNTAYVSGADSWWGSDLPYVAAINGSTGATTIAYLPTPSAAGTEYLYQPGNVAFDSANNGVYVTFNWHEYAYSGSTLKLASSLAFPSSETNPSPLITADGSTHTIYAVGTSRAYKISGPTNTIASSAAFSTPRSAVTAVIDPTIKTFYVGTLVLSEVSLAQTGTLPYGAASVSGSSHTIYSPGYAISRSGT